jgi:hypothetical protein
MNENIGWDCMEVELNSNSIEFILLLLLCLYLCQFVSFIFTYSKLSYLTFSITLLYIYGKEKAHIMCIFMYMLSMINYVSILNC